MANRFTKQKKFLKIFSEQKTPRNARKIRLPRLLETRRMRRGPLARRRPRRTVFYRVKCAHAGDSGDLALTGQVEIVLKPLAIYSAESKRMFVLSL